MSFNTYPSNPYPINSEFLNKLNEVAKSIDNMPTFTSNDKEFLEELPAFPNEDGKKVLTATTENGDTNLSYEASKGSVDFSTSEQNTGIKWIDGKDIYFKSIELGALPNSTQKEVAHNIQNVDKWVLVFGIANNTTDGSAFPLPLVYDNNGAGLNTRFNVSATSIILNTQSDRSAFNECYAYLFYTKATI